MNRWKLSEPKPGVTTGLQYKLANNNGVVRGIKLCNGDDWARHYLKHVPENLLLALKNEEKHKISAAQILAYKNVLCMPVQQSPWVAARVHPKVAPAYTSSTQTLWELHFLRIYTSDVMHESGTPEHRRAQNLSAKLEEEIKLAEDELYKELQGQVYGPHANKKFNHANAVFRFIKKLEQFTLRLINLHEYYLWKVLIEGTELDLPAESFFTGGETPNATKVMISSSGNTSLWGVLIQSIQHMFSLRNEMYLKLKGKVPGSRDHFGYKTLPKDTFDAMGKPGNQIYNGYLLFKTAKLYFSMLNVEHE